MKFSQVNLTHPKGHSKPSILNSLTKNDKQWLNAMVPMDRFLRRPRKLKGNGHG